MVIRDGIYEIKIREKQLICSFCENSRFRHCEIYLDQVQYDIKNLKEQLILQAFRCTVCANIQMFQDKKQFDHVLQKHVSIIQYTEVSNE
nr:hypothetical protein [Lysinibacillus timonensis]